MAAQESDKKRLLLVPHTLGTQALEHLRVLWEKEYDTDIKLGQTIDGPYDLIIQMGLGDGAGLLNGLEHVRLLRQQAPKTPILVVSGHDPSYALQEVTEAGADHYLQKETPGEMEEFLHLVEKILTQKTAG